MIAYIAGTIRAKHERTVVVDVHGVGYLIFVPRTALEKMSLGEEAELFVHTNVREDDISLFGFPTSAEWDFFKLLISVSGVGPKSALEILTTPVEDIQNAIVTRNAAFLTRIPGIGKKTAERIIIDLEGKVTATEKTSTSSAVPRNGNEDIIEALISLGYSRQHVVQGLKRVPSEVVGEESIIKYFLQNR